MTNLKRKAEESAKRNCPMPFNWNEIDVAERAGYVKGYIAGATENGIQWHDLRKDPKDLPPKENDIYSKEVIVCLGAGRYMSSRFSYALQEDGSEHCWECCDPIAWCEIPQFKE